MSGAAPSAPAGVKACRGYSNIGRIDWMQHTLSRRDALGIMGAVFATRASANPLPMIAVSKDPNCACCTGWADYLRKWGFPVVVVEALDLGAIRLRLGVPADLAGCHTAQVAQYVLEGHVPVGAILRLLRERPAGIGLAVPGMPAGSPGMGGTPQAYEVTLFSQARRQSYGRHLGADILP